MSDEPAPKPPEAPKAKTPKAILLLLVMNLGATGFGVFKLMTAQPAEAATHEKKEAVSATEVTGPVMALDPSFVVNLDEPGVGGSAFTARYLKCSIQLELADAEAEHAIEKSKQLIRDAILSHLSGLHIKDTLGAEGKDHIRTELMAKIDKILGPGKVKRMFFQEFVVQ
ncbi:MAG TPA: flagellar basal body-associated FliL family protein [Kofleriaceae bacterium]|nr:flagellar basal body-associated FliL family protein [Kofleriaceae bacterium]